MATYTSTFKAQQDALASSRTLAPSGRLINQHVKYAVFEHVFTVAAATTAAGDIFALGWLNVDGAVIIPELSRITASKVDDTAPSAVSNTWRLESVTAGAAAVVEGLVTASPVTETARTQPFVKLATGKNPALVAGMPNSAGTNSGSYIQVVLVAKTTGPTLGEKITVEVAYRDPKGI